MQTATYDGEQVKVTFTAQDFWTDNGPGTDRWLEVDVTTIRIESVEILGVEVTPDQLAGFPAELVLALHETHKEVEFTPEDE
jgi:hypothetical protein